MGSTGNPHSHKRQGTRYSQTIPPGYYFPTPAKAGKTWKLNFQWEKPGCGRSSCPDQGKVCLRGSGCPGCCCNFPNHKALLGAPAKADPNQACYQHCHLLHGHAPSVVSSEDEPLRSCAFYQSHVTCSSRHTPTSMPTKHPWPKYIFMGMFMIKAHFYSSPYNGALSILGPGMFP